MSLTIFKIVPVTTTVYKPAADGLFQDITLVVSSNCIKVVTCVPLAVTEYV